MSELEKNASVTLYSEDSQIKVGGSTYQGYRRAVIAYYRRNEEAAKLGYTLSQLYSLPSVPE